MVEQEAESYFSSDESFVQELSEIRKRYGRGLGALRSSAISDALALLREDIQDPGRNDPKRPDLFMLRANHIGLALFDTGMYSTADEFYRQLIAMTEQYCKETGQVRHTGAMWANRAGASVMQGNYDRAVVMLLRAADNDVTTYHISRAESYAITGLLQDYFIAPTRNGTLEVVQAVDPRVSLGDLESLGGILGNMEYALLAYVRLCLEHEKINAGFPNEFSRLQIFGSLRNLSSLLEVELKLLCSNMEEDLCPTIKAMFGQKRWWTSYEASGAKWGRPRSRESLSMTASATRSLHQHQTARACLGKAY